MRKAGLKLVVANLVVARLALRTGATAAHERHRDAVPGFPVGDIGAHRLDNSGKLVSWHMRQANLRIVPHPAMPIATAQARCLDRNDRATSRGRGIRHFLNAQWFPERVVNCSLQLLSLLQRWTLRPQVTNTDVLDLKVIIDAVTGAFAALAGFLDATERYIR